MNYNKNIKKYMNECKYLFSSYGNQERKYLNKLVENIDDGSHELTYEEIIERLGTPKEVIIEYYNQEDIYTLIKKAKFRRFLQKILLILLILITGFLLFQSYIYQKTYDEVKNSNDGYFEESIIITD